MKLSDYYRVEAIDWQKYVLFCTKKNVCYVVYVVPPNSQTMNLSEYFPLEKDYFLIKHCHIYNEIVIAVSSFEDIKIKRRDEERIRYSNEELQKRINESLIGGLALKGYQLSALDLLYLHSFIHRTSCMKIFGEHLNGTILDEFVINFVSHYWDEAKEFLDEETILMLSMPFEDFMEYDAENNNLEKEDCKILEEKSCRCQLNFKSPKLSFGLLKEGEFEPGNSMIRSVECEVFSGTISVCSTSGYYLFNDKLCIILNLNQDKDKIQMNNFINKLVLVKEINLLKQNETSIVIIKDMKNIITLATLPNTTEELFIDDGNKCRKNNILQNFPKTMSCNIFGKSMPFIVKNGTLYYALMINYARKGALRSYLILKHDPYMSIYQKLLINRKYILHYKTDLIKRNYSGFSMEQFEVVDGVFELLPNSDMDVEINKHSIPIYNVETINNPSKIICKYSLVSVCGRISNIHFTPNTNRRTEAYKHDYTGFGTPSNLTPKITLRAENNCFSTIDIFLNNWENHYYPIGIIMEAFLVIHNVYIYTSRTNQKYIKSTHMTSFEIVNLPLRLLENCPPQCFVPSINDISQIKILDASDEEEEIKILNIEQAENPPNEIFVCNFNLKTVCPNCDKAVEKVCRPCQFLNSNNLITKITMTIKPKNELVNEQDASNETIFIGDIDFFKRILYRKEFEAKDISDFLLCCCQNIKELNYSYIKNEIQVNDLNISECDEIIQKIVLTIKSILNEINSE